MHLLPQVNQRDLQAPATCTIRNITFVALYIKIHDSHRDVMHGKGRLMAHDHKLVSELQSEQLRARDHGLIAELQLE